MNRKKSPADEYGPYCRAALRINSVCVHCITLVIHLILLWQSQKCFFVYRSVVHTFRVTQITFQESYHDGVMLIKENGFLHSGGNVMHESNKLRYLKHVTIHIQNKRKLCKWFLYTRLSSFWTPKESEVNWRAIEENGGRKLIATTPNKVGKRYEDNDDGYLSFFKINLRLDINVLRNKTASYNRTSISRYLSANAHDAIIMWPMFWQHVI